MSSGKEVGATQVGQFWNRATDMAGWGPRSGHASVVFDTRGQDPPRRNPRSNLWVLGGMSAYADAHNQTSISFEF